MDVIKEKIEQKKKEPFTYLNHNMYKLDTMIETRSKTPQLSKKFKQLRNQSSLSLLKKKGKYRSSSRFETEKVEKPNAY